MKDDDKSSSSSSSDDEKEVKNELDKFDKKMEQKNKEKN